MTKKIKSETVRSSLSYLNKAMQDTTQQIANETEFGNISAYIQRLLLADFKTRGIDTSKILKL